MRLNAALCLSTVIVSHSVTAEAQSANQIVERHIKAVGGKKAVEQIVSTEITGRVTSADGRTGVFTLRAARPLLFSVALSWGDAHWRTGFNGRAAWEDDSSGVRTLYGQAAAHVRAEAQHGNLRLVAPEKIVQLFLVGPDRVRDHPVMVIAALTSDATRRTMFFDADTNLLVKDERETDAGVEERFFDDYRRIGDVLEPHRIEWHRNGDTFEIVVERVAHNTSIDKSVFDVPSSPPEPPLPGIEAVLSTAERNDQEANRRFADYTYSRSSASGRVDGTGRVTLVPGEAHDIFHLAGRPIARLTRKRDGQPLTDAERRQEDERIEKSVREYERQRLSGQAERPVTMAQPLGLVMLRIPVLADGWLPAFRRMCVFSNVRREQMTGRRVLVVEFEPRRGGAARNDFERQAAVTAGTLWIDEALQTVVRIEAYLTDDWERTAKGSSVRVERTLVNGEVWLPLRTEVSTRLQFAFGNLAQFLSTGDYSNHKKFTVSTDSTIALPDAGQ